MSQSDAGLRLLTKYGCPSIWACSYRDPDRPSPGRTSVREDARASSVPADSMAGMSISFRSGESEVVNPSGESEVVPAQPDGCGCAPGRSAYRSAATAELGQQPGLGARYRRCRDALAERAAGSQHVDLGFRDLAAGLDQAGIELRVLAGGRGQVPAVNQHVDE